jgi:hypothetical protein
MITMGGNSGLIDDVWFLTATNSASYNSARILGNLNQYYNLFVNEILNAEDDWDFQGQIAYANLIANQQEYPFPTDILTVKRLEISDGTNWYPVDPMDINEYRTYAIGASANSNNYFESSSPKYSAFDNSLYLHPIPDTAVNSGLKLWYALDATDLSAAANSAVISMEPAFNSSYHRGLSYGVAKDFFQKIGDTSGAKNMENEMEKIIARMKLFYSNRLPDRQYTLKPTYNNYK